ncbi:MAG: hypothetical protein V1754_05630, partial [Pseudomonadota bacterium]
FPPIAKRWNASDMGVNVDIVDIPNGVGELLKPIVEDDDYMQVLWDDDVPPTDMSGFLTHVAGGDVHVTLKQGYGEKEVGDYCDWLGWACTSSLPPLDYT